MSNAAILKFLNLIFMLVKLNYARASTRVHKFFDETPPTFVPKIKSYNNSNLWSTALLRLAQD